MKQFDLTIVTANNKLVYTVEQPQTDEEADKGLARRKYLPEKHGMIYFFEKKLFYIKYELINHISCLLIMYL